MIGNREEEKCTFEVCRGRMVLSPGTIYLLPGNNVDASMLPGINPSEHFLFPLEHRSHSKVMEKTRPRCT